ncbi:restriction endonuclease subunit S [Avibacterium sp. 20-15]|uniref:restriction endonuclease subunit S n=1 Tax=unclassified Avibacterium TaxID=2685287 RepID=UPI002025FE7A|nr:MULTISPECIES: restriction endonuclease subunit S [unclassified Avibacterium]MCW9732892.1 restriction endonuclease subunit S [Avibacterium sp. 20-15]URL02059.1 restriction endonuclease subunit S [Avibacterium sp. 20-126]URL05027.1 restriction endonuclease subunit S [Avibacterium sp. 20-132]
MANFNFQTALTHGQMFLVQSGELDGRLDPLYYQTLENFIFAKQKHYPVSKMSDCIDMQRGRFGHRPRNDPALYGGKYPFIQTGDIVKASMNAGNIPYSQTLNELGLKTSKLQTKKAVIVTIAANIGDTAILDYPACYPDSLIALTPKSDNLRLEYINIYFKYIKSYLENLAPQAAQKNINYQQLAPTPIVIPPLMIQDKIIAKYQQTIKEKQKKEKQAQTLLNSINAYLLNELQITLPETDNRLENRIFTVQMSEISGRAFDAESQFNKHYRIQGGKYANKRLDKLAFLQKGQSITSDDVIAGDYPVIAGGQSSPYTHHIANHNGNVITVSASGSAGYVWYHDYPIFASDCTMIFSKNEDEISTEFLAEVLKLKQQEIYSLAKGGVQTHVYAKDLALLQIPVPSPKIQQKIITHIRQIRQQASNLRQQANEQLVQTKVEIEQMILGVS